MKDNLVRARFNAGNPSLLLKMPKIPIYKISNKLVPYSTLKFKYKIVDCWVQIGEGNSSNMLQESMLS